jgi:hypothetical protein
MKTLALYHGTLTSNVESILCKGLRPRGNEPSHDAYIDRPSLPEFVYLTDHIGLAMSHAIRVSERVHGGTPVSVIEVNLSNRDMLIYPDEDFLAEEFDTCDWSISKLMEFMERYRRDWRKSLKKLRTVAYRGVLKSSSIALWNDLHGIEQFHREKWQQWQKRHSNMRDGKPQSSPVNVTG